MNTHDAWEKIHSQKVWGYPSEHVIRFVARNYYKRNRSEVKILDFGCGTGANTWSLAREELTRMRLISPNLPYRS